MTPTNEAKYIVSLIPGARIEFPNRADALREAEGWAKHYECEAIVYGPCRVVEGIRGRSTIQEFDGRTR